MSGMDATVSGSGETYEAVRDDRNALRKLLEQATTRTAAQWPVVEAALTFIGEDRALADAPNNQMIAKAWHAAFNRLRDAVQAYQEAQQ